MNKQMVMNGSDEKLTLASDLAQMTRLAMTASEEDVRLFAARLVRRYRHSAPELAKQLDEHLRVRPERGRAPFRRAEVAQHDDEPYAPAEALTSDEAGSVLGLLRVPLRGSVLEPLLDAPVKQALNQVVEERKHSARLAALGLQPTRSAIFVGPPGVGKTLSAGWIAAALEVPLYALDLSAVMSSYLGGTGSNLRRVLDFARSQNCVLLLDEIDALAKRRGDDLDVGELKRVVAVILQEIDSWPTTSLLLATTNHPELIDPALWRRFDLIVEFPPPSKAIVEVAISRFLGPDAKRLSSWLGLLTLLLEGKPLSEVERGIYQMRRRLALHPRSESAQIEAFAREHLSGFDRAGRIELAAMLARVSGLSQHTIADLTGVSRDTIRKRTKAETNGSVAEP